MRGILRTLLAAFAALAAAGAHGGDCRVRFAGRVGAKFDALVRARCTGEDARGPYYEETVNAFRTHFDDNHGSFDGWVTSEHGLWQGEYWGKNMLALLAGADYAGDESLRRFAVERTRAFVGEFQRADGYIGTYSDDAYVVPTDPERQRMCWNLWGRKYTLWALVEVYRISGDRTILTAAERLYDQQLSLLDRLGLKLRETGCFDGLPSLSVLKPLLLLYQASGKGRYLDSAREIVAEMDDPDPSDPPPNLVRNAFRPEGVFSWYPPRPGSLREHTKAYELMSCCEGLVEYARVTGERRPLEAAGRIADKLAADELDAMGSVGFMDGFCDAARRVNGISECCDVIHWIRLCAALDRATGDPRHLDRLETAFFNAGLAGIYRDGSWGAHAVRSHGRGHFEAPHQVGMKYHHCCIDNAPRLIRTVSETAVVAEADGTLAVNLYADCRAELADGTLTIEGNYPVGDAVTLRLESARPRALRLRVPGWCGRMSVDGRAAKGPRVTLPPATGRVCRIAFDMTPRIVRGPSRPLLPVSALERDNFEHRDGSRVRTSPAARICRGPLVLARTALLDAAPEDDPEALDGDDAALTLEPFASSAVWGAWKLRMKTVRGWRETKVSDYATAADDKPGTAFSIWFPCAAVDTNEYNSVIHPGADDGTGFWNAKAQGFMYAPAFPFARVDGAANYRFRVLDDRHREHVFSAAAPTAALAPVWAELPTGYVTVTCEGVSADGRIAGPAGSRRFWKAAGFAAGRYPKAARGYREAAVGAYAYIAGMRATQVLLETGRPDPDYELNTYVSKMFAALIRGMLDYAALDPSRTERALAIARAAADHLIRISEPEGAPLAHFPPTYDGRGEKDNGYKAAAFRGQVMLVYPAQVATAFVRLFGRTHETRYLDQAERIAGTYLRLQGEDGTWFLKLRAKDGAPVAPNRLVPVQNAVPMFEELFRVTGKEAYRAAADRAFASVDRTRMVDWNWEGQFEDVDPSVRYANLTKHDACSTAIYLGARYPGDPVRRAQMRELMRFAEDQFVCWEAPYLHGRGERRDEWNDYDSWVTPCALEQYNCYFPIDASAAKLIKAYLALYRAEGRPDDLAKARALGDTATRMQCPDGRIPTWWWPSRASQVSADWINCMVATAEALGELAALQETQE